MNRGEIAVFRSPLFFKNPTASTEMPVIVVRRLVFRVLTGLK